MAKSDSKNGIQFIKNTAIFFCRECSFKTYFVRSPSNVYNNDSHGSDGRV